MASGRGLSETGQARLGAFNFSKPAVANSMISNYNLGTAPNVQTALPAVRGLHTRTCVRASIRVARRRYRFVVHEPCAGVYSKQRNDTLQDTDGTTPMKALYKSVAGTARAY